LKGKTSRLLKWVCPEQDKLEPFTEEKMMQQLLQGKTRAAQACQGTGSQERSLDPCEDRDLLAPSEDETR
jgi:hypothetical protein